ncbi:MAG: signal recognition particle protein [Bdellovibrionales bacterium]|nr:signal recognition particle protein [Bdellovibrionales bacterium]NQZ19142.1 signal recognition particle protein [Bdellovibrionales bacterium]
MFDKLSDRLVDSMRKLSGKGKISEANVEEAIKEIRMSLLEADVNFKVVKRFVENVKTKAMGEEVIRGVDPGQQFTKIVHDELVDLLGNEAVGLELTAQPTVIFLVGLQGVGKTTTASKLALYCKNKLQKKPVMVPVDVYRPAAIEQLKTLGAQIDVPVFNSDAKMKPKKILKEAQKWAIQQEADLVLVDTAGRLQMDQELMKELQDLKSLWKPTEVLLVADAMLGQQSVEVAQGFHDQVGLTGMILTKVDGDARGGAALSIREAIGIPIKFLGLGEKQKDLEVFHPDRLASRILDMGDVVTLVEKAQEVIDEEEAKKSAERMMKGEFTAEDFLSQIRQMKKLGSMESIMKMLPGMGGMMKQMKNMTPPDEEVKKIEAIICSMTPAERQDCRIIRGSRQVRIAKGSGTRVQDVKKFIKQFEEAKKMMSGLMKMGMGGGFPGMGGGFKLPF